MFDLLFTGFVLLAGKAVHFEMTDGEQQGAQPDYRPAPGYPPVQYAQSNPVPVQYGYPREHAYRAQERVDEAYGYAGPANDFYVDVTLPSVSRGAFLTTMQYDPAASAVVLSHSDARTIGFDLSQQRYDIACAGISGDEYAAPIMLPMIGVGNIRISNVKAFITHRDCGTSLLGQSALMQFSEITQRGNRIVFRR